MADLTLTDISEKMRDIDFAVLSTRASGGEIAARPMSNNRQVEYDGDNFFFTLQRAGQPEQRVAVLSVLPPTSYGSMGKVPWLLPGESMDTFVPFLIKPGAAPESFQYYYYAPSHKVIDRLSVGLKASSQPTAQQAAPTANVYTFAGTESITVR